MGLFPADTVYGLAAHAVSEPAIRRLYELKGRGAGKPAAVMFFARADALAAIEPGPRTRAALERLLPGPVTVVVPNPGRRFPAACGDAPDRIGVRVPALTAPLEPLAAVRLPLLQSSANPSGGPDPRRLEDVEASIRAGVDAELDGGELPGTPSTVVDLTRYEDDGSHTVLREGALPPAELAAALAGGR